MNERHFDWLVTLTIAELFELLSWIPHILRAKLHGNEINYCDLNLCLGPLARQPVRRRAGADRRRQRPASTSDLDTEEEL